MADLHVRRADELPVRRVGARPARITAALGGQQRLEPGVGLDLGGGGVDVIGRRRVEVARDVARRDPELAQQRQPEVREVLADAARRPRAGPRPSSRRR